VKEKDLPVNSENSVKMEFILKIVFISLCLSTVAFGHVTYCFDNSNYKLMHHKNGTAIQFVLTAKTTGWVGMGINKTPTMAGADMFIGGVNPDNTTYHNDMHVANVTGNHTLLPDTLPNHWVLDAAAESSDTTVLTYSRQLNTGDAQDMEIKNESIYLLWSFGSNDNTTAQHTKKGVHTVNLFNEAASNGNCPAASTTSTTPSPNSAAVYPASFIFLAILLVAATLF